MAKVRPQAPAELRRKPAARGAAAEVPAAMEILEDLPVPVFMKARDGRYLAVNKAWEAFFGVQRAAFLGKRVEELYPENPEVWRQHVAMDEQLWRSPGSQSYELPVAARDRERRDAVYYKATFPASGAGPAGLVGAIFDVTSRNEAEEALSRSKLLLEQVFENMDEGISVADAELNLVAMNRRFRELHEFPEALCRPGMPFEAFLRYNAERGDYGPGEPEEHVRRRLALARKPEPHHFVRERPTGTVLEVRGVPLPGGGFVRIYADITERHRAERALRESEERFRRTFELAGSGVAHIGLDRRFIRVNRRMTEILGYTEAELLGKTGRELSHPDDLDMINVQRPRLYSGEQEAIRVEKRYVRKDGSTVWVAFTTVLQRDAAGEPQYEIAVFDDITSRKQAEAAQRESEERFRHTFELAASGIAHVDLEGRVVRANKSLGEILGYEAQELVGKSVKELSHPDDRDVTDTQRARVYRGELESARFEKRYLRKDGAAVWVELAVALVRRADGDPIYEIAIFDDITERKEAEAALRAAHEELKRSNAELEQFAYVASHDLQEPLRMVSSYTQLLGRRYGDKLDADAKEFMGYVVDGAARMKQLIEDLLAYSRVGTKGKEFAPVRLEAALSRALANLRTAIQESSATVTFEALPTVEADDTQLAQLFQNLIGNALKFRSQSVPRIEVKGVEHETEWEISVRDNGIGIDPQYFERIFMVFQRLHNKADYPGTGIGLAICKKVVERHGGRIWVASAPGEGTSFHFTLPKDRGRQNA